MIRLKLLLNPNDHTSFHQSLLQRLVEPYFELVNWQENVHYDRKDHVLVVNSIRDLTNQRRWYQTYLQDGYKIIIDNLWESEIAMYVFPDSIENCFVLQNQNWFWYNEAELSRNHVTSYNYQPARHYQKLALLAMRRSCQHRDALLVYLSEILDQIVWSYTSHGRNLPNDCIESQTPTTFQRHFNPSWYDNTYFSIVAETLTEAPKIFVTEKTFKPMAFYHPFVVLAQAGHLKYVRDIGFETFDNLFDEGYDNINDRIERLTALVATVKNFDPVPYDQLTLQKLEHNHNRFYDRSLTDPRVINEIIKPMIEYAESR